MPALNPQTRTPETTLTESTTLTETRAATAVTAPTGTGSDEVSAADAAAERAGGRVRVVAVVGNPRPGSRTAALATALARAIAELAQAGEPEILDLAELTERIGPPLGSGSAPRWAEPLRALHAADLLVVASPTYKGSYTGLLKSFLDQVDGGALRDIVAVPVTTVGSPAHTLAADVHLRPLLIELGASTPTSALVVAGDRLEEPQAAVAAWLTRNEDLLSRILLLPPGSPSS
jgi:FMN reductase